MSHDPSEIILKSFGFSETFLTIISVENGVVVNIVETW